MKDNNEIKNRTYALLRAGNRVTEVCSHVGISRRTFYLWQEKDPKFKEEIDLIAKENNDMQVTEAKRSVRKKICGFYYKEIEEKYVLDDKGEKKLKEIIIWERYMPPSAKIIIRIIEARDPEFLKKRGQGNSTCLTNSNILELWRKDQKQKT
jgi:hypothetical protein